MLNDQLAPSFKKIRERFLAVCASKTYSFSTLTQGNSRRCRSTSSRWRVSCFSLMSSSLRSRLPFRCGYRFWTFYGARFHDEISPLIRVFEISLGW
jgi:hypothetical protein